jgi:hypothetical protein
VIENFNVESNGVQINIFSTCVVALVFASILLIMCRMQGTAVRQQLPVYYNYLLFTCATFFIVIVLLLLPRGSTVNLARVAHCRRAAHCAAVGGAIGRRFLSLLARRQRLGRLARRQALVSSLAAVLMRRSRRSDRGQSPVLRLLRRNCCCRSCSVCISSWSLSSSRSCRRAFPARPALRWWAGYQLVAHVIFLTQYILYVLHPYDEVTDCIDVIALAGYYLAYAPILLVVVAADSAYWRSHGALLRHYQQQSVNGDDDAADIEDREQDERESQPQPQFGGSDDSAASRLVHASLLVWQQNDRLAVALGRRRAAACERVHLVHADQRDRLRLARGRRRARRRSVWRRARGHVSRAPVAIKLLRQLPSSAISDVMRDLLRESRMMLALRSEHVVECVGVILDDDHLGIVTELMEISMWDALHNTTEASRDVWPLQRTVALMGDVARGLQYLHTRRPPIIHRDIKCHAKDTPILMADGSVKRVQCVAVGDRVMGDDGSARQRALALSSGRDQQLVEIGAQSSK